MDIQTRNMSIIKVQVQNERRVPQGSVEGNI